jgi:ADP-heptose:LPS heptosyltransferase
LDPKTKLVLIHPGSGGTAKCWPLDNFAALARHPQTNNLQVAFFLGPAEREAVLVGPDLPT